MKKGTKTIGKVSTRKDTVTQLRLYIAGQTHGSFAALTNLKRICTDHLEGKYELEVIDLAKNPRLAHGNQILAIPTLVRNLPVPIRKIIRDLSNADCVLVGLDLHAPERETAKSSPQHDRRLGTKA
jgi:circadian clock protein KaiB